MTRPRNQPITAADTYNAAADTFDHEALSFWDRAGRRTVERLGLAPGARVLDVCCGSGASAIPAARAVGPDGAVIGVDLAERLLALARRKAGAEGVRNADFRVADMLALPFPPASFDAVICVFGIFFASDMPEALRRLCRVVRPGGRVAITTWGADTFEPGISLFWRAIRDARPDLVRAFNPWDRIATADGLRAVLHEGGVRDAEIVEDNYRHPVPSGEHWWSMLMGSGYRGTIDQLAPEQRAQVRKRVLAELNTAAIREVEANMIYAVAQVAPGRPN